MPHDPSVANSGRPLRPYELDIDRAERLVQTAYKSESFCAADYAVASHFARLYDGGSAELLALCVVILDGMFATQLFRDKGAHDRILSSLRRDWAHILEAVHRLDGVELEHSPDGVYEVATEVFPAILKPPPGPSGKVRSNYSFCSKFFHWLTRRHFPMVDSNARSAINAFQRDHGVSRGLVLASTAEMWGETHVQEYKRWTTFYAHLVGGLRPDERARLLRADFDSQPLALRIRHSLLRTLDLVFYTARGKESLAVRGGQEGVARG